jgi:2-desacetyl-2-hydroxyethyl bacteriochlorophyllide A dehydrogenase
VFWKLEAGNWKLETVPMKAAILRAPLELKIEDVPVPQAKAGEVLIRVRASAICGTDVSIYKGLEPCVLPVIQGHESTGEVVEIGQGVVDLRVGDRVVLTSIISCRRCSYCLSGKANLCPNGGLLGREVPGSFAEYVTVPDYNAIKIPDSIGYECGTHLVALATVYVAQQKISITPGQTVAVIGQGTTGLLHARISVLSGAMPVYAVELSPWKLDIARQYGAVPVNAAAVDPVEYIKHETGGEGVDLAIEAAGTGTTLRQAMEMVKPGGTVLCFGILPPRVEDFYGYAMYFKELRLIGSRSVTHRGFELGINLLQSGTFNGDPLITHRFTLEQTPAALEFVSKNSGDVLRAVISH